MNDLKEKVEKWFAENDEKMEHEGEPYVCLTLPELLEFVEGLEKRISCPCCRSKMVSIRGRFPHTPDRELCPTCLIEKIEDTMNNAFNQLGNAKQLTQQ